MSNMDKKISQRNKASKKKKALEDERKELETSQAEEQSKATKKSCGCC